MHCLAVVGLKKLILFFFHVVIYHSTTTMFTQQRNTVANHIWSNKYPCEKEVHLVVLNVHLECTLKFKSML